VSSEIDICNLALAHLGDTATVSSIDPPEGSAQAEHCARFYPIARDSLLEMHPWSFATKRALLALTTSPSWNWMFAYAQPNDALNLLSVLPDLASSDDPTQEFDSEVDDSGNEIILTNQETASLIYSCRITDPTKFSPLFTDALGWLLASHLAGPILKGDAGAAMAKQCLSMFAAILSKATASDSNQRKRRPDHTPAFIAARGAKPITSWNF
jgi:hypothetical protein